MTDSDGQYIVIDMHAINMNAVASHGVIGFPAITAFAGFTDTLRRQLVLDFPEVKFHGFAISSKRYELVAIDVSAWEKDLCLNRRPMGRAGKHAPLKLEARARGHIAIAIKASGVDMESCSEHIKRIVARSRLCGGDIHAFEVHCISAFDDEGQKSVLRKLMPGHAIISRSDIVVVDQGKNRSGLESVIDHISLFRTYDKEQDKWCIMEKDKQGWLVPIVVGYQGLTDPVPVTSGRSPEQDHLFAEPLITLGEFKMPCNVNTVDDLLWHTEKRDRLYVCSQGEQ